MVRSILAALMCAALLSPAIEAGTVPTRIVGPGLAHPGAVADAGVAAAASRVLIEQHIDLLAPGARPDDFHLVSNRVWSGMRTLGFLQTSGGVPVVGGQLSMRFKHDRLVLIASQALPNVPVLRGAITEQAAAQAALAVLGGGSWRAHPGPMEIVSVPSTGSPYRLTRRVDVERDHPIDRRRLWVSADSGAVVAEQSLLSSASTELAYRVPVRSPDAQRDLYPARLAEVTVDDQAMVTDQSGQILWDDADPGLCQATASGPQVTVHNAAGDPAVTSLQLVDGEVVIWDGGSDESLDAQLTTFIHAGLAIEHARTLDATMDWLDAPLSATVNIDQDCNALSDGSAIFLFRSDDECHNTGRLADIIYHEVGHVLHRQSIVSGVGAFDAAFSEGAADYFSASITGDPIISPGFYKSGDRLRHIDPAGTEARWPEDASDSPHDTGLIFAGAMWDLRKALIAELGPQDGAAHADQLFYAAVRHSVDIPSSYAEVLVADDDDGNLQNGTPHRCAIDAAFAAHGLTDPALVGRIGSPVVTGLTVAIPITAPAGQCSQRAVESMALLWRPAGTDRLARIEMNPVADGFRASLPDLPDGSAIEYRIEVSFADGTTTELPSNPAAQFYQLYTGPVTELYCTDFELPPSTDGWTTGAEPEPDEWTWGQPQSSQGRGGDPIEPFSGGYVLGTDLGGFDRDATYEPNASSFARSPRVAVPTSARSIRLQYRRWLRVQDGSHDRARITSNGHEVWRNREGDGDLTFADAEWRFHDVDLTHTVQDGAVQVRFELDADGAVELGGWTLDDVCIVAYPALCQGVECSCPDGDCVEPRPADCGCQGADGTGATSMVLVALALAGGLRRRRRQIEVEIRRSAEQSSTI